MNEGDVRQTTILLIEEDDDTRRPMVENLRSHGYHVIVTLDEEDALERIDGGQVQVDLVLVDLVRKSTEEALRVGRSVREYAKSDGHTPLVVMPEKYGKEVEGTEMDAGGDDWIFYLGEEYGQLSNLLARLTSGVQRKTN